MRFETWYRRAGRRADAQMWGGLALMVITFAAAYSLRDLSSQGGDLARAIIGQFHWLILLPAVAGLFFAMRGCWLTWQLHKDPVRLYNEQ
jgi:hypothetical protein